MDKLLKDRENSLKGQDGWDRKKLTEELEALKVKDATREKEAKESKLQAVADKYGVDIEKAKEVSNDPELLERAFSLAGREPAKISSKPDSGKGGGGGGALTIEQVKRMTNKELRENAAEIGKMPLALGAKE